MDSFDNHMEKLRAVFDLCDAEKQGFISVEHFSELAKEHFGAGGGDEGQEAISSIVNVLDPQRDGRIGFPDFCKGVRQILELQSPCSPAVTGDLSSQLYQLGATDSIGSEETLVPPEDDANSCGTHETSEVSTFNEYDMMTDDDQAPGSAAVSENGLHPLDQLNLPSSMRPMLNSEDDRDSAISGRSSEYPDHRREQDMTDEEERFEDYGEVEDAESETDSQSQASRPRTLHIPASCQNGEVHRKCRHRDKREWLHSRKPSSNNRRLLSGVLASHLYRSGSPANGSRRSSCSDEIFDDIDGSFSELNDKVKKLEDQIHMLSENQEQTDQRYVRQKEENTCLVERVHQLEEQLREVEVKAREQLTEEQKKHREMLTRAEKESSAEVDMLSQRLRHIEQEYTPLKDEAPRLRQENDRLRRENHQLETSLTDAQSQLLRLSEEHQELQERAQQERADMEQERVINAQLLDELTKELEELRSYKTDPSRARSRSIEMPRNQRKEWEAHIVRLKEENARLRELHEELQAQLLSSHIQEGRNLLQMGAGASLAQEIENLPKDELMKALKEQQESNAKLREYVDRLTLRILDKNPALLEVDKPQK